jgi:predicted AlkP superfamily pyrophosphatase or phosphodiesterase
VRQASLLALALAAALAAAPRPKLLVLIVAEQCRADYLEHSGGFRKLLSGGAWFRECRYEYAATYPASGAAVLATGAYPERNGIVAEQWYDRRAKRVVRASEDLAAPSVSSPRRLVGTTLADQMRLAGRSRAVSISLRDQTAVMLGGRRPAGCYWMDAAGRFVSSPYYSDPLPAWANKFVQDRPALRLRGRPWRALDARDDAPPLRVIDGPRIEDFLATYLASPLAVDEQFDFARETVAAEELGQGPGTDLLALSISSLYLLGLETGADSPLVRDIMARLDRRVEEFVSWLEQRLGAGNVWVVFTATQGLAESPGALEASGIPTGRIAGEQIAGAVNARLGELFGRANYVEKFVFPSLYLRPEAIGALRAEDVSRVAGEAALGVHGVADYWGADRTGDRRLARGRFPGRSGDLLLVYQPYFWERYGDARGLTTGSYYAYDARVPLVLYGPAFRHRAFAQPVEAVDLAPTLAAALKIAPPSSTTGRVLVEALEEP